MDTIFAVCNDNGYFLNTRNGKMEEHPSIFKHFFSNPAII